jgi:glycosyltransferase involved in cell wall biosynthesis
MRVFSMRTPSITKDDQFLSSVSNPQQPINVLHIIHSLTWGGAENQVVTLAPTLNSKRYRNHVCCLRSEGVQAYSLRAKGIQVVSLNMRLRYWPITVCKLYCLIKQMKPQIIHAHMYDAGIWATLVGKLAGVPVILTTEPGMTLKKRRHLLPIHLVNHFNDKMIATSEEIRQCYIQNRVISPEKVITIPSAVDVERFSGLNYRNELRTQLGVNTSSLLVGTVARLVQAKRLDRLLEAARMVCNAVPQAQFMIIGDGPMREKLEGQAMRLDLAPKYVRFLGNRQDVTDFLSALDIFALSSETEGIPVALLEAMAASKPVVATRVGGIPQVIQDRHNGLLVSPNDPAGLSKAILTLMEDSTLRESVGREGHRTVTACFSVDVVSQQIVALYDSLLEKKGHLVT